MSKKQLKSAVAERNATAAKMAKLAKGELTAAEITAVTGTTGTESTLAIPLPTATQDAINAHKQFKSAIAPATVPMQAVAPSDVEALRAENATLRARVAELEAQLAASKAQVQAVATDKRTVAELRKECKAQGIRGYSTLKKGELLALLAKTPAERATTRVATGKATVADLKAACKAAGLKVGGTKAELTARLAAHKLSQGSTGAPVALAAAASPAK